MKNLPSNIEAEKQLLGSILLDNENIGNVIELLKPECFYYAPNRIIYKAILDLYNENIVADTVSVFEKLKGTVNPADIAKCTQDISSAANAGYLARVVYEKYMRRELIKTAEEIIKGNEDESKDVFELLSEAQNKISVVTENISQSEKNLFDRLDEIIGSLKSRLVSDDDSLQSEYFPTLNKITNGFRKGNMISLSGKDKTGKCHAKGTKILKADGKTINVENIKIGDLLLGVDGSTREVLEVGCGYGKLFEISLDRNKGKEKFVVNGDHILCLKRNEDTRKTFPKYVNISVNDYLQWSKTLQKLYFLYRPELVKFPQKKITIEPYFLGLWLGDGDTSCVRITNEDKEVVNYLDEYSKRINLFLSKTGRNKYGITTQKKGNHQNNFSLQKELRKYSLLNNKHIPHDFLVNSEENRLELLAGLLDSDGCVNKNTRNLCYTFTNKNEKLCDQIVYLCRSLGLSAYKSSKIAKLKSRNYECLVYNIRINGDVSRIPIKIARKKIYPRTLTRNRLTENFSVKEIGCDHFYGFALDKDHLYLLDNFIVNHNTTFGYKLALDFAVNSKIPIGIFSFEMSQEVLDWKALSLETGINYNKLRNPKGWNEATRLSESEIDNLALQAGRKFYRTKIYTCDKVLNELQIKAKMKKWIKEYGVEFFVIDYIGLIPTAKKIETREREVSYLSRFFKTTTAELNTRTLILSQQNRAGELAESLGLERDPDFALTIQKPFEEGVRQIKLNSGDEQQIFDLTENDFLVTLKRSRHGKQGNQFLVGYPENSNDFVEKSLHSCNTF